MVTQAKVHDVYYLVREPISIPELMEELSMLKGISPREAAMELCVSERTVLRMLQDGRLEGKKVLLPDKNHIWDVTPVSVAKMLLLKEETGKYPKPKKKEEKDVKQ